jgi:hypothetical protein
MTAQLDYPWQIGTTVQHPNFRFYFTAQTGTIHHPQYQKQPSQRIEHRRELISWAPEAMNPLSPLVTHSPKTLRS